MFVHVYRLKDCRLGFYHTGLELLGLEFTFCCGPGIVQHLPKMCEFADYLGTVELGNISITMAQLQEILTYMKEEGGFRGDTYDVMERSCNTFTEVGSVVISHCHC